MERMWRKMNQGLTSFSKTAHSTDTASSAGFGDVPKVAAVSSSTSKVSRRHQNQQSLNAGVMSNTASSERRRRRRKRSRPRRSGGDG